MTPRYARPTDTSAPRGMLYELELLLRRLRVLLVAAPILLLTGFGAGEATRVILRLQEPDAPDPNVTKAAEGRVKLDVLSSQMNAMRAMRIKGEHTVGVVEKYRQDVEPVERVLLKRGLSLRAAREISWPLVRESKEKGLEPATVMAILMVESGGKRTARSPVGARGLMQVMPHWAGRWRSCGRDLYDVDDNLCTGTNVLRWYLKQHGTERKALLGYNGCVQGTNTPRCFTYPDKVWRLREQIRLELSRERTRIAEEALN
jgi:soluble lytic murein transglycosylase-like protein